MVDIAAGFATCGATALVHTFAMFASGRVYDQIRNNIAYPRLNVKIIGSHGGLTVGQDGAAHQCIEDMSLMRTIPGMTVVVPCDANEAHFETKVILDYEGPCYLRTGRDAVECVTDGFKDYQFKLEKGIRLVNGTDVTIIVCGLMVQEALKAQTLLAEEGISARVIDMHTIKPIDKDIIMKAAKETGAIVTAEEHNVLGGPGSAVAEVVAASEIVPVELVGVNDTFGHSGSPQELLEKYGLTTEHIVRCVKKSIQRKK